MSACFNLKLKKFAYPDTKEGAMNIDNLPTFILSTKENSHNISRWQKSGKIRKITANIYTSNIDDDLDKFIERRILELVSLVYPGAMIADRSAFDLQPTATNELFIISEKAKVSTFGKYTVYPRKGNAPLESDLPFLNNLYQPSVARKFLENVKTVRRRTSRMPRYLTKHELEERLDAYLRTYGETAFNRLRDEMRAIAPALDLEKEFATISDIMGAMLGTREAPLLSDVAVARRSGNAFDPQREILFTRLYEALSSQAPLFRKTDNNASSVLCFYEAYFSNYIEGTKFTVEEAHDIVFNNKIPEHRPDDAHDIAGTYNVLADLTEMKKTPSTFEDFLALLRRRHKIIMDGRPGVAPGRFKTKCNQAGTTLFVSPDLIEGTLRKGFELYKRLDNAFNRAVFMMFMVSEVHPFNDGNGRLARIMMNAELVAAAEQRIIIPTVYRLNYTQSLKALSHNQITDAFIKTLDFAQKYTAMIDWTDLSRATDMLCATNAFIENSEDETARLRLPV